VAKKDKSKEERLLETKPKPSLNHIVKERYPTFVDALRDLDDALCMLFLFAQMPQTHKVGVSIPPPYCPVTPTHQQLLCTMYPLFPLAPRPPFTQSHNDYCGKHLLIELMASGSNKLS
jgi:hypothetical protein